MNKLKELRINANIKQTDLAHLAGVSQRHIAFLENGKRQPSIGVALRIANVFRVSVNDIFSIEQEAQAWANE